MTIRRNVDLAALNRDYSDFTVGCSEAPKGMFAFSRSVGDRLIGPCLDGLEETARVEGVGIDPCDRMREVEVLMFDMIRASNPDTEIETAIGLGRALCEAPDKAARTALIDRLRRDRDFLRASTSSKVAA